MEVPKHFIALIILVFISSLVESTQTAFFPRSNNQENYTVCSETEQYDSLSLSCENHQLIHVTNLVVGNRVNCSSPTAVKCSWNERDSLASSCEGKHGLCRHFWVLRPSVCPTINYMQVGFQCINDYDVHNMCPYGSTRQYHSKPTYYKTPKFDEYPFAYNLNLRCECRLTTPLNHNIEIELIYLDLERSTYFCHDSISFENGAKICSSHLYGNIRIKFYSQTNWKFTSDGSIKGRGGWLKVSLRGKGGYYVTCSETSRTTYSTSFRTRTTRTTRTRYAWAADSYGNWTTQQQPYVNVGGIIGGAIGGFVALLVVIFIIAVVISQKRIHRTQRAVAYRAPVTSHQPYPQQPIGYDGPLGSDGIPPAEPTEHYGPPPSYSSLQLESNFTSTSGTAGTFPPPPITTGPV